MLTSYRLLKRGGRPRLDDEPRRENKPGLPAQEAKPCSSSPVIQIATAAQSLKANDRNG
jgi:hypothetical protein